MNIIEENRSVKNLKDILVLFAVIILSGMSAAVKIHAVDLSVTNKGEGATQTRIASEALKYIGVPYVSGGVTVKGFDCSGLVYKVFKDAASMEVPRTVPDLMSSGAIVSEPLMKADLLFFDTDGKGKASHVGISLGGKKFLHAASEGSKTGIIISELTEDYYKKRYLGSRRLIPSEYPSIKVILANLVPVKQRFQGVITPGFPLYVNIENKLTKSLFLSVKAYKDKKLVIARRIKVSDSATSSSWFIPDDGNWTISIEDVKNAEIAAILLY
jgi:hypothetical protein